MIDMNLDFLVNAVVCDYPSLASITFRTMKGEELVLNYWNGDGYDWDDHFNPISDKKDEFKEIHAEFKEGCRVELVKMNDKQAPPIGTKGTVFGVDDAGSIMVSWDSGSHLSIIYGEDLCRKINE